MLCQSSTLLSCRTAAVSASGFLLHQDKCFVALVPYAGHSPVSALRVGLSFNPWPTSCLGCNPLGSASKTIFRLSQLCWTPAYLTDFPRSAWAWNHPLSPFQYATFQFPQLFSGFGNDPADGIDCASLSYKPPLEVDGRSWPPVILQFAVSDLLSFCIAIFLSITFSLLSVFSLEDIETAMEGEGNVISKRNLIFVHWHQTNRVVYRWEGSSLGS